MGGETECLALGVAAVACGFDLATRRIPNGLTYGALAMAVGIGLLPAAEPDVLSRLGGIAAGFAPGFLLFTLGGLGGGDVKLAAALGGLIGAALIVDVLILTVLLGAVLALIALARDRQAPAGIPFALPMFAALVVVLDRGPIDWRLL